jgi:hypothetical protein
VVEVIFVVLRRWVEGTDLFRPLFKLNVLEFQPGVNENPFRLSVY